MTKTRNVDNIRASVTAGLRLFRLNDNKGVAYTAAVLGTATGFVAYYGDHFSIIKSILFGSGYHTVEFYVWLCIIKECVSGMNKSGAEVVQRFKEAAKILRESRENKVSDVKE